MFGSLEKKNGEGLGLWRLEDDFFGNLVVYMEMNCWILKGKLCPCNISSSTFWKSYIAGVMHFNGGRNMSFVHFAYNMMHENSRAWCICLSPFCTLAASPWCLYNAIFSILHTHTHTHTWLFLKLPRHLNLHYLFSYQDLRSKIQDVWRSYHGHDDKLMIS